MKAKALLCFQAVTTAALIQSTSILKAQSVYEPYSFTTLAGGGGYRAPGRTDAAEKFWIPAGVAVDSSGTLYVGDLFNSVIRKVSPAGEVSILAGLTGSYGITDGDTNTARFSGPFGVALDTEGNVLVAESDYHTIRKVTPLGLVSTVAGQPGVVGSADGPANQAQFGSGPIGGPFFVTADLQGNLYVADYGNQTIRKVTSSGEVSTLAGVAGEPGSADGQDRAARFNGPMGLATDPQGNLYVADSGNHTIRKITPAGAVSTLAGTAGSPGSADGKGTLAQFNGPQGLTVDASGNVYLADFRNDTVRKLTSAGVVTTLAGLAGSSGSADGPGNLARFNHPSAVAVDAAGNVFVAETRNNRIRRVTAAGAVTTVAGLGGINGSADGSGPAALFRGPASVAVDPAGNTYVADQVNHTIRKVTPTGTVSTLAGRAGIAGSVNATGTAARFDSPVRVAVDSAGNVYVTEWLQNQIRRITPAGTVTTAAIVQDAFSLSGGLALDPNGNIYAADFLNHTIRQVDPAGESTILAGTTELPGSADGVGPDATFNYPYALALDPSRNLYVTDFANHTIRKVTPEGRVTTLAGLPGSAGSADGVGNQARFWGPMGVAVDPMSNVYVADTFNNTIRKVTPAGVVTTVGGRAGQVGAEDGTGSAARFDSPTDVAVDAAGVLYVADYYFSTLRKGTAALALASPEATFSGNIQQFGFTLVGPVTQSVVIEASTNLTQWIPISTNALTAPVHFSDPIGAILRNRFYRAHSR